jgi:hypothetical protein
VPIRQYELTFTAINTHADETIVRHADARRALGKVARDRHRVVLVGWLPSRRIRRVLRGVVAGVQEERTEVVCRRSRGTKPRDARLHADDNRNLCRSSQGVLAPRGQFGNRWRYSTRRTGRSTMTVMFAPDLTLAPSTGKPIAIDCAAEAAMSEAAKRTDLNMARGATKRWSWAGWEAGR